MPKYLLQATYSAVGAKGLLKEGGSKRRAAAKTLVESLGGKMDCFSCATFGSERAAAWKGFSFLNERHMLFAWASLISVGSADLYIRLLATHAILDVRIL